MAVGACATELECVGLGWPQLATQTKLTPKTNALAVVPCGRVIGCFAALWRDSSTRRNTAASCCPDAKSQGSNRRRERYVFVLCS